MGMRGASLGSIYYLFLSFCLLFISGAWASTPSGVEWLKQQQRQDGAFYTDQTSSTEYQATIESLLALGDLESLSDTQRDSGVGFLLQPDLSFHSEFHSRMDLLAEQFGLTDTIDSGIVSERIAYNGGVGGYPGHDGSVLNTALALNAWASGDSVSPDKLDRAITFLLSNQQADGGWSEAPNFTSTYVTAITSQSLQRYRFRYPVGASISAASEYLLANQSSDGWGSIVETALALQALIPVITDSTRYQTGLENLKVGQTENGSWGGDVFATALALRALYQVSSAPEPVDPSAGSIEGQVIDSNTRQPIENAVVTAQGDSSYSAKSGQDGRFRLTDMEPDDYSLSYQASGFQGVNQSGRVGAGQHLSVGTIEMSPLPDSGLISGVIRDAQGIPIPGAQVSLAGASAGQTVSDENGRYALSSLPGDIQLAVSSEGYVTVTAAASVVAGSHLNFSPVLYLEGNPPPQDVSVQGKVVDSDTGEGLGNVSVEVLEKGLSAKSSSNGSFILEGLEVEETQVQLSMSGYENTVIGFIPAVGGNDLGVVALRKQSATTTISGKVKDSESGASLSGAKVSAAGVEAVSDAEGAYRLEGISVTEFDIRASFSGYLSAAMNLTIQEPGNINLDIPLQKASVEGVGFEALTTDRNQYQSYNAVLLESTLRNQGDRPRTVRLYVNVFGSNGDLFEQYPAVDLEEGHDGHSHHHHGDTEAFITLEPGQQEIVPANWNTDAFPPGEYRIVVQAVDASEGAVLAEHEVTISVVATQNVELLIIKPEPAYTTQGATEDVAFSVQALHYSNMPSSLSGDFQLVSPDGNVIHNGQWDLELEPEQPQKRTVLDAVPLTFEHPGEHTIRVQAGSVQPKAIQGAPLYVAPGTRLEIEQGLSPSVVVPEGDTNLGIEVRLRGEAQ